MRTELALLLAAALGGCEHTGGRTGQADVLPADVVSFVEQRVLCEHFLQEEPYDAERRAFLQRSVEATCTGTDAALLALRKRHAEDPDVTARLAEFEHPLGY